MREYGYKVLLRYAFNGLNDCMVPKGVSPSLLAFVTRTSIPMTTTNVKKQQERIKVISLTHNEVAITRAGQSVDTV